MNDEQQKSGKNTPDLPQQLVSLDERRSEKIQHFQLQLDEDALGAAAPEIPPVNNGKIEENLTSHSQPAAKEQQGEETGAKARRAQRARKKAEKKRKKKKARKNGCLFKMIWLVMIVLVSVVLAQFVLVGVNDMLAVNRTQDTTTVVVLPKDVSIDEVADILQENNVINKSSFFKLYTKLTKRTGGFSKGTYEIKTNMDYEAIINYLQSQQNRVDTVEVRFTEGMNLRQYAQLLEENKVCSAEAFLEKCNSDEFDEDYPFLKEITNKSDRYYKLEGYLFPDTYVFYEDEKPEKAIRRFLSNYRNKVVKKAKVEGYDEKVSIEELAQERGMTPDQLLTLASMVQSEANAQEGDMEKVASVFLNRLNPEKNNNGENVTHLGSDPTKWYPYRLQKEAPEGFVSRYNTYDIIGLPPGPICNPSMAAIQAVLNPAQTDYLYFCHAQDEQGTAYYATNLRQHEQNLKKAGLSE